MVMNGNYNLTHLVTIGEVQLVKDVPEADRENIKQIFLDHLWNSYRMEAACLLGDLWINHEGGERSRDEGLKLIRRVQKQLLEQV